MPNYVLGHIFELNYMEITGTYREPNLVITSVIANVMKKFAKAQKITRAHAIFLYEQEVLRASQTNTLAYNIVWG